MAKIILRNSKIDGNIILNKPFVFEWTLKNLPQNAWSDITYGPVNTLVAIGLNSWSYSFDNGSTWGSLSTINTDPGNKFYNSIAYGNGKWSVIESINNPFASRNCFTSTNILTGWTRSNFLGTTLNPIFSSLFAYPDMLFNPINNKFLAFVDQRNQTVVATNATIVYSDDGINWLSGGYFAQDGTPLTNPQGFGHGVVGTNMPNNRLAAVGGGAGGHKMGYSNNGGLSWIKGSYNPNSLGQNLQVGHNWTQVAYGVGSTSLPLSGRFVTVNNSGSTNTYQFAYSNDGIDWIGVSYPTGSALKKNWQYVTYAGGYFVALTPTDGYQAQSVDGINWTLYQNLPYKNTNQVIDLTVANKRLVAVYGNVTGSNAAVSDFY